MASSGCVKFKHGTRSGADSITVGIQNTSTSVLKHDIVPGKTFHRFDIENFMSLVMVAWKAGYNDSKVFIMDIEDIFPVKDTSICTVIPASTAPGACNDGGCCQFSLNVAFHCEGPDDDKSVFVHMKARTSHRGENGTHMFVICEQEFHGTPGPAEEADVEEFTGHTTHGPLVQGLCSDDYTWCSSIVSSLSWFNGYCQHCQY